ncbi:MAG: DUF2950 family protein [Pseudoruegeria sp.]
MIRSAIKVSGFCTGMLIATDVQAQQSFESYAAAAEAVASALRAGSASGLLAIFGEGNEDAILTGDAVQDRENWTAFLKAYETEHAFRIESDGVTYLLLGEDDWAFPIPMVIQEGAVSFDVEAGREELLLREIGGNEVLMIEVLQRYVEAQAEYRAMDPDEDGIHSFASHFISESGQKDGLYWPGGDSPVGDVFARASLSGYVSEDGEEVAAPFGGYYFHMLEGQGAHAPGGAMSYSVNGHQVAGHALVAVPEVYGETGFTSFMVAENGWIYEADLGEDSVELVFGMTLFDPSDDWELLSE